MALTVNNFTGFETQGNEEAVSITGSVSYPVTSPRSGNTNLLLNTSGQEYDLPWVKNVTDAGDDYIIGFSFRALDPITDSNPIISIFDSEDNEILTIRWGTTPNLVFHDANGFSVASINLPEENRWYRIEIYFQHSESSLFNVVIDDVIESNLSGKDLSNGNSLNSSAFIRFHRGANTYEIDDVYILSGASSVNDRLGGAEVYMKQGAQTGTTPDTSDLADTVLNEGTWQLASETPLNEQSQAAAASYTGGAAAGVVYADGAGDKLGPVGDDRFTGATIKAMKGIWRMARGNGGGTAQFGEIGNDGGTASDIETTGDLNLTTGYINYEYLTETASTIPSTSENAAIGFSKDGGAQDLDVAEMWVMFLVVPDVPSITDLADAEWPDQNYYVGPFEI